MPTTLVQIHYHDRVGGVTTVVGHYARAFARVTGAARTRNIVVCHRTRKGNAFGGDVRIASLQACDYHAFRSLDTFSRLRSVLVSRVGRIIAREAAKGEVCVVGHNLTLGKNCALSSAFTDLAAALGGDCVRFLSVVHDLAEEGRADMLAQIDRLANRGYAIWDDLYAVGSPVAFVVLNRRNQRLLANLGCQVIYLPNPVDAGEGGERVRVGRPRVLGLVAELARKDGVPFNVRKRTVLYPARIISRKNVAEAIVLACFLLDANLLLGGMGTSADDRRMCRRLRDTCVQLGLPVVLDVPRIAPGLGRTVSSGDVLRVLYRHVDLCVSTSIAEGFGYALFEPWLHSRPLVGRLPMGLGCREVADLSCLYTTLPVPSDWVSIPALARRYRESGIACFGENREFGKKRSFESYFRQTLVKDGQVDFGVLDLQRQLGVVRTLSRLLRSADPGAHRWIGSSRIRVEKCMPGRELVGANHELVTNRYSFECFVDCFVPRVLRGSIGHGRRARTATDSVRRYFADLKRFRLLLTPHA